MFKIFKLLPYNFDIVLTKKVFPQPVSPINITGILALIRSNIKINFAKLSAVNTNESRYFSKNSTFLLEFVENSRFFFFNSSGSKVDFLILRIFTNSSRKHLLSFIRS